LSYFDNFDNGLLNKYKNLNWRCFKLYIISLSFDNLLKNINGLNLMIFIVNELSNDNEIIWNLKHYHFISNTIYLYFFIWKIFYLFKQITHYQRIPLLLCSGEYTPVLVIIIHTTLIKGIELSFALTQSLNL
jgi:hypothetical protein